MRYGVTSSISCCRLIPRVRRVMSRTSVLNLSRAFGAMRRSLPSFEMLNPRNLRSSGRATALFASLTFSRSFWVRWSLAFAQVQSFMTAESDSPAEESGFELLVPLTTEKTLCDALGVQKRKYSHASAALMLAFTEGADATLYVVRIEDLGRVDLVKVDCTATAKGDIAPGTAS